MPVVTRRGGEWVTAEAGSSMVEDEHRRRRRCRRRPPPAPATGVVLQRRCVADRSLPSDEHDAAALRDRVDDYRRAANNGVQVCVYIVVLLLTFSCSFAVVVSGSSGQID